MRMPIKAEGVNPRPGLQKTREPSKSEKSELAEQAQAGGTSITAGEVRATTHTSQCANANQTAEMEPPPGFQNIGQPHTSEKATHI